MDFSFFWGGETSTLNMIVTSAYVGIMLASLAILYNKRYVGGLIRRLIDAQSFDEAGAKSLSELGYRKFSPIRFSLRKGSTLRKAVFPVGSGDGVKYYVQEEKKDELLFKYDKKGTNIVVLVVCAGILFLVAAAVIKYYPELTKRLSEAISSETQA